MTCWINTGIISPNFNELLPTIDSNNPNFLVIDYLEILKEYFQIHRNKFGLKTIERMVREFMGIEANKTLKNGINVYILDIPDYIEYWRGYIQKTNFPVKYLHFICTCQCENKKNSIKNLNKSVAIKFVTILY